MKEKLSELTVVDVKEEDMRMIRKGWVFHTLLEPVVLGGRFVPDCILAKDISKLFTILILFCKTSQC